MANDEGKFETEFQFPSSGNYFVKATFDSLETTYSQLAVDLTVSQNGMGDTSNIQAAIDAAPQGGTVYIQSGTYDLLGKYLLLKNNVSLIGAGVDQTIIRLHPAKQNTSASFVIYSSETLKNLHLENFTIIQNAYGYANHCVPGGIGLEGSQNIDITIRNVRITDVSGEAIFVHNYSNMLIENCIVERAWTGIAPQIGSNAIIRNNTIISTNGDGIFTQIQASNVTIQNNYLENIGDTAIDITGSVSWGLQSEANVTARDNIIVNGTVRVSNAIDVQLINNNIQNGQIIVDGGAGSPIRIKVNGNSVVSYGTVGIGFRGAVYSSAENNIIEMKNAGTNITQSGITAAIWQEGLISNNTILNPANYGIDFAGWGLGSGQNITISDNIIQNFGTYGIYDNEKYIMNVYIQNNIFETSSPDAMAVKECAANQWILSNNSVTNVSET
jgi:parallel beta-helix repeat protein